MNKKFFRWLLALWIIVLCIGLSACGMKAEPLSSPRNLQVEKRILTWDPVENATGYRVSIRQKEYDVADCRLELYAMTMDGGAYHIEVVALGDQKEYSDSSGAKVSVELEAPALHGFDEIFSYTFLEEKAGYEVNLIDKESTKLIGPVVIPDYFGDYPVKRLANHMFSLYQGIGALPNPFTEAFCNKITTKLTLPKHLEEIGASAVSYMVQLKEIVIPDSVTQIGNYAFSGNKRMTRVVLPKYLKEIPVGCFENTALSDIIWPEMLESIGPQAFLNETIEFLNNAHIASELSVIVLPDSVKSIGGLAFMGRENLRSVNVPRSLEELQEEVFYGTAWIEAQPEGFVYWGNILYGYKGDLPEDPVLVIPESTEAIAGGAFAFAYSEHITKIIIPSGVKLLGSLVFNGCVALSEVVLPQDLEQIPASAFAGCSNLKSVTLPKSIKKIGDKAFSHCDSLRYVYYEGTSFSELLKSYEGKDESDIEKLEALPIYYYAETAPTEEGNYWHYVDGKPTPWET